VSRVGRDPLGREAIRLLEERGLDLSAMTLDPCRPTGTVAVALSPEGQPQFSIQEAVAWDELTVDPDQLSRIGQAEALCFGTLAQRSPASREVVRRCVEAVSPDALRICDINLRAPFYTAEAIEESLRMANVLKLNETELLELAEQFRLTGSAEEQLAALAKRFGLHTVVLTLGAQGSRVLREGHWTFEPGRRVEVRDAVGAGDAFTAAFVLGILRGWPVQDIQRRATDIAAFVCTQSGATPDLSATLTQPFLST
ncbi:MAG: 5-dehydro-2-deoxygluconokinase, partial [Verrucomicrobiota bacterium]